MPERAGGILHRTQRREYKNVKQTLRCNGSGADYRGVLAVWSGSIERIKVKEQRNRKQVRIDEMGHHDAMARKRPSEKARERFKAKPYNIGERMGSDKNAGRKANQ